MSQAVQTISLRTTVSGSPILTEALSGGVITPGMLVQESGTTVIAHGTAAGNAQRLFAQTNKIVAGSIDTAYASGELVSFGAYHGGQEVNALVAAAAVAIVNGDALESAGNGTLRKVTTAAATADTARDSIVAYAMEAIDNSGGGSSVRIKVRIA